MATIHSPWLGGVSSQQLQAALDWFGLVPSGFRRRIGFRRGLGLRLLFVFLDLDVDRGLAALAVALLLPEQLGLGGARAQLLEQLLIVRSFLLGLRRGGVHEHLDGSG